MIIAWIAALAATPPDTTPLTLVHGDEQIVTWLDRGSMRRTGERVRSRVLRVRHADQAFWVVQDIDCAARTWARIANRSADGEDRSPPPLDGDGEHFAIHRYDRAGLALRDAVCDGAFLDTGISPVEGASAAIDLLEEAKAASVRARPLELIVVRSGPEPVFIDRATLDLGGPQWEVRSLKITRGQGLWSMWMVDCTRRDLAVDLYWRAPLVDGAYGTVTRDERFGGVAAADADEAAVVAGACDPGVWDHTAHGSIEAAVRAASANPG